MLPFPGISRLRSFWAYRLSSLKYSPSSRFSSFRPWAMVFCIYSSEKIPWSRAGTLMPWSASFGSAAPSDIPFSSGEAASFVSSGFSSGFSSGSSSAAKPLPGLPLSGLPPSGKPLSGLLFTVLSSPGFSSGLLSASSAGFSGCFSSSSSSPWLFPLSIRSPRVTPAFKSSPNSIFEGEMGLCAAAFFSGGSAPAGF